MGCVGDNFEGREESGWKVHIGKHHHSMDQEYAQSRRIFYITTVDFPSLLEDKIEYQVSRIKFYYV